MLTIYILELQNNKFYIGKTSNLEKRLQTHYTNSDIEWVRKHSPIIDVEIIDEEIDKYSEEFMTLMMMDEHGIDNVRGGIFCNLILTDIDRNIIHRFLCSFNNLCYHCGSDKHYSNKCDLKSFIIV